MRKILNSIFSILLCFSLEAQQYELDTTFRFDIPFKRVNGVFGMLQYDDTSILAYGSLGDQTISTTFPINNVFKFSTKSLQVDTAFNINRLTNSNIENLRTNCIQKIENNILAFEYGNVFMNGLIRDSVYMHNLSKIPFGLAFISDFLYIPETKKKIFCEDSMAEAILPGSDTVRAGGFKMFQLNENGSYDSTFSHNVDRGITNYTKIKDSVYMLTGHFNYYDSVPRHNIAFIDCYGNLLDSPNLLEFGFNHPIPICVDKEGRIMLSGALKLADEPFKTYSKLRLLADGSLDTTFHYKLYDFDLAMPSETDYVRGIDDGSGYILVGYYNSFLGQHRGSIAKIHYDGTLDTLEFAGEGFNGTHKFNTLDYDPLAECIYQFGDYIYVGGNIRYYDSILTQAVTRFRKIVKPSPPVIYSNFNVYPNPSKGVFTLNYPSEVKPTNLRIVAADGKLIFETTSVSQDMQLDLSSYSDGTYIITLSSPTEQFQKRILKN